MNRYVIASIIFSKIALIFTTDIVLEAEHFMDKSSILQRSNASNVHSVRIKKGGFLYIEFCLPRETVVSVKDVFMSNDGLKDQVDVLLDGYLVGVLNTETDFQHGAGWNTFKSFGQDMRPVTLLAGEHSLILNISMSDFYGVEIDFIQLHILGEISEDILRCKVFCFDHINDYFCGKNAWYSSKYNATIKQFSRKTECTEEENINIPFYFHQNTRYEITASHPKYPSMINHRKVDLTNCDKAKSKLWSFKNIAIPSMYSKYTSSGAILNLSSSYEGFDVTINFPQGSEPIGVVLRLKLKYIFSSIRLAIWYNTKQGKRVIKYQRYSPGDKEITLNIPDYTWSPGLFAELGLKFPATGTYLIDEIDLHPRDQEPDKSIKIFKNHNLHIEGFVVDHWWKETANLQVTRTDIGKTFTGLDYIKVFTQVPWSKINYFSPVFVLHGDGYARLLPISPQGTDWIPFGSSMILGRSDPSLKRPTAPISHINLDPRRLKLTVDFLNHDTVVIDLKWTFDETIVKADYYSFPGNNLNLPVLTYRSMWISDGIADVDSLKVDNKPSSRINSNWKEFNGTSFVFYRRCLSSHNTMSPDITVRILPKRMP